MRNKIKTKVGCLKLILIIRNIQTFLITFIITCFKLTLHSLLLRSLFCIIFYTLFGINTAHAWVDKNGVEHDNNSPRWRSHRGTFFHLGRDNLPSDIPERLKFDQGFDIDNNPNNMGYNTIRKVLSTGPSVNNTQIPTPSEHPSNNPTPLPLRDNNTSTIPPMPDIHPILIDPTNPPQ